MNSTHRIVFRADGNSQIGLGHVVRLISLIEILNNEFNCIFLIRKPDKKVLSLIESFCPIVVLQADDIVTEMHELEGILKPDDVVVTDGYCFTASYQLFIKSKVHKLIMVDDKADQQYYADLIINHGDPSLRDAYNKEPYTKLLLGFEYLIARKEFLAAAREQRKIDQVDAVFICMGGADPNYITGKALDACLEMAFIKKIIVVTGGAFINKELLELKIKSNKAGKSIVHEENVNASRLIELINMCQIGICTSSSISLELCCVKIGLLTGMVVNNQAAIHKQLVDSGCCISLHDFNLVSREDIGSFLKELNNADIIDAITQKQSRAIDGLSGKRILMEFQKLIAC